MKNEWQICNEQFQSGNSLNTHLMKFVMLTFIITLIIHLVDAKNEYLPEISLTLVSATTDCIEQESHSYLPTLPPLSRKLAGTNSLG